MWPFKYHAVDEVWQRSTCQSLDLRYNRANGVSAGSSNMPLTRPDMRRIKRIQGDGNCMFRSLSYLVTGSQDQHFDIRTKIVQHMSAIESDILGQIKSHSGYADCHSVAEYVQKTKMDRDGSWGTGTEMVCFAHLTNTCVFSYLQELDYWERHGPHNVNKSYLWM